MITTERLILRAWKNEDVLPYAEMNADPRVREFFPSVLTREQSEAEIRRLQAIYDRDGFSLFAAELIETGEFVGFIGLLTMTFAVPFIAQPAVELRTTGRATVSRVRGRPRLGTARPIWRCR